MKERPILFSGEMVRAILEGRKTQTRRVLKPQPKVDGKYLLWSPNKNFHFDGRLDQISWGIEDACPYGKFGDRLWVRETWVSGTMNGGDIWYRYRATDEKDVLEGTKWKPSIFMKRHASRILLEVVSVRVERLQDISEEDAEAEGISQLFDEKTKRSRPECNSDSWKNYLWHGNWGQYGMGNKKSDAWHYQYSGYEKARDSFSSLWEAINGPGSWEKNPWVWVIEFKRVDA